MRIALVLLVLAACKEPPKRTAPRLSAAVVDAGNVEIDPQTLALARKARDAATALAQTCELYSSREDGVAQFWDSCNWHSSDREAMRAAAAALTAGAADAGPAIVFVEHVRLFAEWTERADAGGRGTLAHYQDLARAWSSLRPSEAVAADVRFPNVRKGATPDAGAAPLVWERCATGACLIIPDRPR